MRNFAALEALDKHKERRPQRAEISQASAAWQAGQPDLILEWWLLPPLHWCQLSSPGNPQKLLQTAVYRCIWTHKTSFKETAWGHSSFSTFIYFLLLFCTVSYIWWRWVTKCAITTQWEATLRWHAADQLDFDCSWKSGSMLWMQTGPREDNLEDGDFDLESQRSSEEE